MLLVLLIAVFWAAGLLLVVGLCAAARRGDRESALAQASERAIAEPLAPVIAARAHERAVPPMRVAA